VIVNSRYTLTHALGATLALGALVFSGGFGKFWHQFVYGLNVRMTPEALLQTLGMSTVLFGTLLLTLWGSTKIIRGRSPDVPAPTPAPDRWAAVKTAVRWMPLLAVVALALNWLGANAINWLTDVKPSDQELVKCFVDGNYSLSLRAFLVLVVLFQAPLLEEPIFRGVIFRGLLHRLPFGSAALLSGAIFAFVHVNAASFVALWFLGTAFAVLYRRTGTILAPMTVHFLFNALNLVLLWLFPEMATNS